MSEGCQTCEGTGSVCLACNLPIDECECFEDSEPCICDRCNGTGLLVEGGRDAD